MGVPPVIIYVLMGFSLAKTIYFGGSTHFRKPPNPLEMAEIFPSSMAQPLPRSRAQLEGLGCRRGAGAIAGRLYPTLLWLKSAKTMENMLWSFMFTTMIWVFLMVFQNMSSGKFGSIVPHLPGEGC